MVLFEVGDEELVRRISGRRTCSLCNKVFNIYTAPPASPATDCVAGSSEHQLFQRKDDEEATVKERLRVYEEKTRPVLSYYSGSGLLRTVRAEGALEEITARLLKALADSVAPAPAAAKKSPAKKRPAKRQRGSASPGEEARESASASRRAAQEAGGQAGRGAEAASGPQVRQRSARRQARRETAGTSPGQVTVAPPSR